jgi:hypothetical protein
MEEKPWECLRAYKLRFFRKVPVEKNGHNEGNDEDYERNPYPDHG